MELQQLRADLERKEARQMLSLVNPRNAAPVKAFSVKAVQSITADAEI